MLRPFHVRPCPYAIERGCVEVGIEVEVGPQRITIRSRQWAPLFQVLGDLCIPEPHSVTQEGGLIVVIIMREP